MKSIFHSKNFFLILLTCLLMPSCTYEDINKCIELPKPLDTYSYYPYVPGTPEWVSLGNTNNLFKACQLPMDKLKSISNSGLAQSLIDNPCLSLISAYSNIFIGRNAILLRLNASFELNKRKDGAAALVSLYSKLTPACYPSTASTLAQGSFIENWRMHEVLLTQDSLLNQLNHLEKIEIASILITKYQQKSQSGFDFGSCMTSNVLVLSQLMRLDQYSSYLNELSLNANLLNYADSGYTTDHRVMESKIISFGKNYIKN
jgi:hypothetical protein